MITGRTITEELRRDKHNGKTISSQVHSIAAPPTMSSLLLQFPGVLALLVTT